MLTRRRLAASGLASLEQSRDAASLILGPVSHNDDPAADKGGLNPSRQKAA